MKYVGPLLNIAVLAGIATATIVIGKVLTGQLLGVIAGALLMLTGLILWVVSGVGL